MQCMPIAFVGKIYVLSETWNAKVETKERQSTGVFNHAFIVIKAPREEDWNADLCTISCIEDICHPYI